TSPLYRYRAGPAPRQPFEPPCFSRHPPGRQSQPSNASFPYALPDKRIKRDKNTRAGREPARLWMNFIRFQFEIEYNPHRKLRPYTDSGIAIRYVFFYTI